MGLVVYQIIEQEKALTSDG